MSWYCWQWWVRRLWWVPWRRISLGRRFSSSWSHGCLGKGVRRLIRTRAVTSYWFVGWSVLSSWLKGSGWHLSSVLLKSPSIRPISPSKPTSTSSTFTDSLSKNCPPNSYGRSWCPNSNLTWVSPKSVISSLPLHTNLLKAYLIDCKCTGKLILKMIFSLTIVKSTSNLRINSLLQITLCNNSANYSKFIF